MSKLALAGVITSASPGCGGGAAAWCRPRPPLRPARRVGGRRRRRRRRRRCVSYMYTKQTKTSQREHKHHAGSLVLPRALRRCGGCPIHGGRCGGDPRCGRRCEGRPSRPPPPPPCPPGERTGGEGWTADLRDRESVAVGKNGPAGHYTLPISRFFGVPQLSTSFVHASQSYFRTLSIFLDPEQQPSFYFSSFYSVSGSRRALADCTRCERVGADLQSKPRRSYAHHTSVFKGRQSDRVEWSCSVVA